MKKAFRIGIVMVLLLSMALTPGVTYAVKDAEGHWGESGSERWNSQGDHHLVTRAEFYHILNHTFQFTETADIPFNDVKGDWNESVVSKALAAGYVEDTTKPALRPNQPISREEFVKVMAHVLEMQTEGKGESVTFKDKKHMSTATREAVGAMVEVGYMKGVNKNKFHLSKKVSKDQFIVVLNRIFEEVYSEQGTYADQTIEGNLLVASNELSLNNITVKGNLYLAQGVNFPNGVVVEGDIIRVGPGDYEEQSEVPEGTLRIHFQNDQETYEDLGVWIWNDVASPTENWPKGALPFEGTDEYGAYVDIKLKENAQNVGFLVVNRVSGEKQLEDQSVQLTTPEKNEVWVQQGGKKVLPYEPIELEENEVRIHYVREDDTYDDLGLWVWEDVKEPSKDWPIGALSFDGVDEYGAYVDVTLKEDAEKLGFLVLNKETGDKEAGDKVFSLLDQYNRLWIKEGDDTVYTSPYWETPTGLVSAEVLSQNKLLLSYTMTKGLTEDQLKEAITIVDKEGKEVTVEGVSIVDETTVKLDVSITPDMAPFEVTFAGRTVSADVGWRMIDELYSYEGDDLGATYENGNATLKLWAPTASNVVATFYDKEKWDKSIGQIPLTKGEKGVWKVDAKASDLGVEDLRGYYYQYEVTNNGETKTVLDPYAKSMAPFTVNTKGEAGPDGDKTGKAAIVDLSQTNPENFTHADIPGFKKREDAVIWEVHVRDFTSDPSISGELNNQWGTFNSFSEKLEYVKSLGVTHIQILPVMAWYYGDETRMDERELEYSAANNSYNWGYDPHNYFSPDGAYSENPADPEQRVKELKQMIHEIHEADMGVVLDVVYTHMAKSDFLNDIVPDYYFYQDSDGNFIGGFGNNLAANHKMAEKLMVDSVKYWFDEYKIDGMRFDMMGDAYNESIQNAYNAAAEINPDALFIGEGWRTFGGAKAEPALEGQGADQDWMDETNDVGVFSDEMRNELKSGFGSEGEPRFITGGARSIDTIFNNIKGQPSNTPADDPGDMVQYIAAHDNLPLYDVIAQSIQKDPSVPENHEEIHKRIRLGNTMVLTSQGTAFLHAGQEYGRTKQWFGEGVPEQKYHEFTDEDGNPFGYFIHDSYDSSDAINMFNWDKATNEEDHPVSTTTKDFTAGLVKLRQSTNAFRLGEMELVNENVTRVAAPEIQDEDLVVAYKAQSTDGTGSYYVFINADSETRNLTLDTDLTKGTVLVDHDEAGTQEVQSPSGFTLASDSITLDPLTTVIVKVEE
ncbi:pullulanase [Pontibacillus chungwhensis BH030062]|uniref:pullulanase n=1 Tax=Pontibacillus chungwhensis BH030062 TaxID=1385513 RepID=A0A0A2V1D6_9BACI|nr:pullulanase [Pontibacillus chungwhensis]KGP92626.1 pullulanase [Pontibacillus chungwhensis BH030062]